MCTLWAGQRARVQFYTFYCLYYKQQNHVLSETNTDLYTPKTSLLYNLNKTAIITRQHRPYAPGEDRHYIHKGWIHHPQPIFVSQSSRPESIYWLTAWSLIALVYLALVMLASSTLFLWLSLTVTVLPETHHRLPSVQAGVVKLPAYDQYVASWSASSKIKLTSMLSK